MMPEKLLQDGTGDGMLLCFKSISTDCGGVMGLVKLEMGLAKLTDVPVNGYPGLCGIMLDGLVMDMDGLSPMLSLLLGFGKPSISESSYLESGVSGSRLPVLLKVSSGEPSIPSMYLIHFFFLLKK